MLFVEGEGKGEVPLFDGDAYPASSAALTDVMLGVLPRPLFVDLMHTYPSVAITATKILGQRLRHFGGLIEDLSLRRVPSRVARLLITHEREPLTQTQMATMVGSAREVSNRPLHQLEDEGIIEVQPQQIVVLDSQRLTQIADEG